MMKKSLRDFFADNKNSIFFSVASIVIFLFYGLFIFRTLNVNIIGHNAKITVALIITAAVAAVIIALAFKGKETIVMSIILIVLLSAYIVIFPLGKAPDENEHFLRAYEISNGSMVSKHLGESGVGGNILPETITSFRDKNATIDWNKTAEFKFGNTSLYAPITYLPHIVGIKIASIFTDNVQKIFISGRASSAICCLALCIWALSVIPFGRRLLFIFMAMPMTMQGMLSLAPDGFIIALAFLFFSYILKVSYGDKKISKFDIVLLSVLGISIALCKIVYVVLLLLLFIIPTDKFKNKKNSLLFKFLLIGAAGILNLAWLKVSAGYLVEFMPGVSPKEQVMYILTKPFEYIKIVIKTVYIYMGNWISNLVGYKLGWFDMRIHKIIYESTVVLICYDAYETLLNREIKQKIHKYDVWILGLTFLAGFGLIATSLYVQWTAFSSRVILGIQGRYFIPLMPAIVFAVLLAKQKRKNEYLPNFDRQNYISVVSVVMILNNIIALLDIIPYSTLPIK